MIWHYLLLLVLICFNVSLATKLAVCSADDIADADIEDQTFTNSGPIGVAPSVTILKQFNVKNNNNCFKMCCYREQCDAISISRNLCTLFTCNPTDACKPKKMSEFGPNMLYIVLRTASNTTTNAFQRKKLDENSESCEIGVPNNCPANSMCRRIQDDKRSGMCRCISGFVSRSNGCVEESQKQYTNIPKIEELSTRTTKKPAPKKITTPSTRKSTKAIQALSTVKSVTKVSEIFAHAGPDLHFRVTNPRASSHSEIVSIYGSATDKDGLVNTEGVLYHWKRDMTSLSVGEIVNRSDHTAALMLMSLIQGQYKFELTVTDKNGDQSSDSVNIFVTEKPDDTFGNLVDVLFETNVYKFSKQETINFSRRMGHVIEKNLLYDNCQVHVTSVSGDSENRTQISFYAELVDAKTKEIQILSAGMLEEKLKWKLTQHKFIFDYSIRKFQSRVCYNSCGGHGQCSSYSHRCKCTFPWMVNQWHERSTGLSNCDMHMMIIIVVCVAALFMTVLLILSLKALTKICKRKRRHGKDVLRYKLIDNAES